MLLDQLRLDLRQRGFKPHTINDYVRILRPIVTTEVAVPLTKTGIGGWIYEAPSPSTKRHRYLAVNALCRMLVDDGELDRNPCSLVTMPKDKAAPQPVLSETDYKALLASCDKTWLGKRDRALLSVLASTGCRRAELVGMLRADCNTDAGQVLIRDGKNNTWRVAYLDDAAKKAVLVYLRAAKDSRYLWTTFDGRAMSTNAFRCMLQRRSEQVGVKVTAHQFRRRMATQWLLAGGSQVGLMNAAGWSNPTMPARYTALAAQDIAASEWARMQAGKR